MFITMLMGWKHFLQGQYQYRRYKLTNKTISLWQLITLSSGGIRHLLVLRYWEFICGVSTSVRSTLRDSVAHMLSLAQDENGQDRMESRGKRGSGGLWKRIQNMLPGGADGLPNSNPRGWPHSTAEDLLERPKRIVKIGMPQVFSFRDNNVKTSKYELYSFLPKFLFEEFNPRSKIANCYFLVISGLQCIPVVSNTNGYPTTLIPLLVVVLVDALFQIFEDVKRHAADLRANSSESHVFDSEQYIFESCLWSQIVVGDVVKIHNRQIVPADVVILSVSDKVEAGSNAPRTNPGICYIETKSLDGETNLKIRSALPLTRNVIKTEMNIAELHGEVEMEHPNKLVDSFNGVISFQGIGRDVIQHNHILLRGCVLRNTDFIYGLVVNTGHDTKIMMSSSSTKMKASKLENAASMEITRVIGILIFLCFWGATGQSIWNAVYHVKTIGYLKWQQDQNPIAFWFIDLFYFFLLHATFIPVSLYVSMSMTRYLQSYFMQKDPDMTDFTTNTPAIVRTMTLNEELGQISHIFSDKTGTLTCNNMDFRKMSINGVLYGQGITEIGKAAWKLQNKLIPASVLEGESRAQANSVPHVSFYCSKYNTDIKRVGANNDEQREKIAYFFRVLAICHDVIPEKVERAANFVTPHDPRGGNIPSPSIKYSASNPDDEALVCAAKYFGFEFVDRKDEIITVINRHYYEHQEIAPKASYDKVKVLLTIPFSSKRKRMSVVVQDLETNSISLLCKGADTVILPRLKSGQEMLIKQTMKQVRDYSVEGLRCLFVAAATLRDQDFWRWKDEYDRMVTDIRELEKRNNGDPNNKIDELEDILEQSLFLLGATAIEDKLQAGVPDCIASLVKAGCIIWVLTGDKEETAINIAVACNLLQPTTYMDHIIVNTNVAPDRPALQRLLQAEIARYDADLVSEDNNFKPRALIIDGPALLMILHEDVNVSAAVAAGAKSAEEDNERLAQKKMLSAVDNMSDKDPAESLGAPTTNVLKELLLDLSLRCKAVVGCRVSPDQKKEMVRLIKDNVPNARTLAIGDGANDVAMIQEAHVGIGIKGEEGTQAVNSADFAIAQFRFLGDLMLKHGRYNYLRMSNLVCYMFYKNILMSMGMFWFNFNCGFSGQKYYTEGAIQLYNLAYTSIPIILYAIKDIDVSRETVFHFPQLYQATVNSEYFTVRNAFMCWLFTGCLFSTSSSTSSRLLCFGHGSLPPSWSPSFCRCYLCLLCIISAMEVRTLSFSRG